MNREESRSYASKYRMARVFRSYRDQYTVVKASQANVTPPRARKNANTD